MTDVTTLSSAAALSSSTDRTTSLQSVIVQTSAAIILGAVMIYAAGFSNMSLAHNVAHDARHAVAFPCH